MATFVIPDGWVVQAYRFALDPTPAQARALASHAGAARFAHNHMLALVKAVLDQRAAERSYDLTADELTPSLGWSLAALRKTWNTRKCEHAPWWSENSKEAYNTGLDGLARALDNWSKSRTGLRAGKAVGFPRFKSARSRRSVRFTTGTIRVDTDRHHITLPRLGTIHTYESTRKLARRIDSGSARVLSATAAQDAAGRWYCSFQTIVAAKALPEHTARSRHPVVGVDVGVENLLVVATPDGTEITRVPAPKSLARAQKRLRSLQRTSARQHGRYNAATQTKQQPSRRWRTTQGRIGRTHARAANVRRDVLHKATTALAQQYDVIVVETLNASGMRSGGGAYKRGLNRALADAALAMIRRMLAYKTRWYGSTLIEADRYFPSSKTCSACGGRKPNLTLADRTYNCQHCGVTIDRDHNAAINLARLGGTGIGSSPTANHRVGEGRGARQKTQPARAARAAGNEASTRHDTQSGFGQSGTASPEGEAA